MFAEVRLLCQGKDKRDPQKGGKQRLVGLLPPETQRDWLVGRQERKLEEPQQAGARHRSICCHIPGGALPRLQLPGASLRDCGPVRRSGGSRAGEQ